MHLSDISDEEKREQLDQRLVQMIVDSQWPAIQETLKAEFATDPASLALVLRAGRRACERMVEHLL
ncbi:MAG: hypothetical protein WC145_05940 [Aliarcobacter sp.]